MIHQPSGGFRGQASDIEIHAQETLNLKKRLNEIYAKHTGQKVATIEKPWIAIILCRLKKPKNLVLLILLLKTHLKLFKNGKEKRRHNRPVMFILW